MLNDINNYIERLYKKAKKLGYCNCALDPNHRMDEGFFLMTINPTTTHEMVISRGQGFWNFSKNNHRLFQEFERVKLILPTR